MFVESEVINLKNDKIELLNCINNCPDTFISKEIIFNVIKWNYDKIDVIIQCLKDEKLIDVYNFENDKERYKVSSKGNLYIKDNFDNQKQMKIKAKQDFFDKYTFPTILSIITFVLGIIASLIFK